MVKKVLLILVLTSLVMSGCAQSDSPKQEEIMATMVELSLQQTRIADERAATQTALALPATPTTGALEDVLAPTPEQDSPPATEPPTDVPPPPTDIQPTPVPMPTSTEAGPAIVFLPEGVFSAAERAAITQKVINPFTHYYRDLEGHPALSTITIERYSGDPMYPFKALAVFEDGAYIGWLMPATGGVVDWWIPECMGPCQVSDSFRAAYPEIMAILEP